MSENRESESSLDQPEEPVTPLQHIDSKEDLFEDAPEELTSTASKETSPAVSKDGNDFNNGVEDNQYLVDELERVCELLDRAVNEKNSIEKKCKEERETFARELGGLRRQLKVLTDKELGEVDGGLIDGLGEPETAVSVEDVGLDDLMSKCSQFLRNALEERSQRESALRELNEVLHAKDQEIDDLNAKVAELSVSHEVTTSYLNSVVNESAGAQFEKDQYVESVADRMSGYLAMVVHQEELVDYSIWGKISQVERSTYALIEKYNQMLYQIYELAQCLSNIKPDLQVQEEFGLVFAGASSELIELKRREAELIEKVGHLENENGRFVEQVAKDRESLEAVNAEFSKAKTDLEQEKARCANTKEKLSLAVSKGKALVQQRDLLKQSLAEKTAELEKCLAELQEKSCALQAAELSQEELVKSANVVASLQEMLSQKASIKERSEEVLSQIDVPENFLQMDLVERIEWLLNERNELKVIYGDFVKLKDILSSIDLPETVSFTDLESCLVWLKESFYQSKNEASVLLSELDRTKEVARNEIDHLTASLSTEVQEKQHFQKELVDLTSKYEEMAASADELSSEKNKILEILVEESGAVEEDQEEAYQTSSDMVMLIGKYLAKFKEKSGASLDTSGADLEIFERMQSLLFVRSQELTLYELLLEEEMQFRLQLHDLSNNLRVVSEELDALKKEKESLEKDLDRSEEKSSLLREKLSMAVKKGKGLVQERENLKSQLDEKNSEIEKLKLQLQQQESTVSQCMDQISRLSTELESIPKLEADVIAVKDQRDQLEQFLSESNSMLQRVIESIDHIIVPVDLVFKEPVEKVNWISEYINESQNVKTQLEQELGKVKEEADALTSNLADAQATAKSLEDSLSVAHDTIARLTEEKRDVEVGNENVEQELAKALEEARIQTSKFSEASVSLQSIEDKLSEAENRISQLISEKEEAQRSGSAAVTELEEVREEVSSQTSKLTEAYKTIKSLEEALSQVENNVMVLTEQNNVVQVGRSTLENELQKMKDEAESQAAKLAEAHATIKYMEDALSKAETDISTFENEKRNAEQERSSLDSSLEKELQKMKNEAESHSVELAEAQAIIKSMKDALLKAETDISALQDEKRIAEQERLKLGSTLENELQKIKDQAESQAVKLADAQTTIKTLEEALSKAETDVSVLQDEKRIAEQEISTLDAKLKACMEELAGTSGSLQSKSVELIGHLNDLQMLIKDDKLLSKMKQSFEKKIEGLQNMDRIIKGIVDQVIDKDSELLLSHPDDEVHSHAAASFANNIDDIQIENGEMNGADDDNISSCFRKTAAEFQLRNKVFSDKVESFSAYLDEIIAVIIKKLQRVEDEVISMTHNSEMLRQKVDSLETYKQEQDEASAVLKNDVRVLLSACSDAARELQLEVKNDLLDLQTVPELENLRTALQDVDDTTMHQHKYLSDKYTETAHLSSSLRKTQNVYKLFEATSTVAAAKIQDLQQKLLETTTDFGKAIEERDLCQMKVSKLETELKIIQDSCKELRHEIEDYQASEKILKEKEAEISAHYDSLLMKQEAEKSLLSASEVKALLEKISEIDIPFAESETRGLESETSVYLRKLYYIIDSAAQLNHKINLLEYESEDLHSTVSTQTAEIKQLKEEIEMHVRDKTDFEKTRREFSELTLVLEKIFDMLGGNELLADKKSALVECLPALVKQVKVFVSEAEDSKFKTQELAMKLLESQKFIDDLTAKVKSLEDSIQDRTVKPEIVQERSIFETPTLPSGSEISEIEDVGTAAKNTISPVPSAAQLRIMRKASSDHLAINVEPETASLINNEHTDEEKGHIFKSLNTTGLIPKQGKMIADRVDGIWVSGGRVLMARPQARLGLIVYSLLLHMWLLGTIIL